MGIAATARFDWRGARRWGSSLLVLLPAACGRAPSGPGVETAPVAAVDSEPPVEPDAPALPAETVEQPDNTADTDVSCTDLPAELLCGVGNHGSPFVPLIDHQEVELDTLGNGLTVIMSAVQARNSEQLVRLAQRVTDVETGEVLHDLRTLYAFVPTDAGEWRCEGSLTGLATVIAFQGLFLRELHTALCGREVLIEMATEAPESPEAEPIVRATCSARVVLRPSRWLDPPITCP